MAELWQNCGRIVAVSQPLLTSQPFPLQLGETYLLSGTAAQQDFGRHLAAALPKGSVLFLEGELGAGKTTLTQGLVSAFGFTDPVTSPTYALMNLYPTALGGILHVDAYRVNHVEELYEMDLDTLIENSLLSVIEWGEGLYADFPVAPILKLEHLDQNPELRRVTRLR